jgi:hypothetical protein
MNDLASAHPEVAESMAKTWDAWHADIGDLHKPASGKIKLEKKKKERSPRKK